MALRQFNALAGSLSEIIEFRTPCLAASNRPDVYYVRRVQREDSLDTLISDNTPNCKSLVYPAAFARNHRARKDLSADLVAFLNLAMYIDRIAYLKIGHLLLKTFAFYRI